MAARDISTDPEAFLAAASLFPRVEWPLDLGRMNEEGEQLVITVISKLLCSPSSPSTRIIANCTLLASVMVGVQVQVDRKDIARLDKRCY